MCIIWGFSSIALSIYLSCLCVFRLYIYLSNNTPIYLSTYLNIYLSTYISIYQSIHLYIYLNIYFSIHLSVSLVARRMVTACWATTARRPSPSTGNPAPRLERKFVVCKKKVFTQSSIDFWFSFFLVFKLFWFSQSTTHINANVLTVLLTCL